MHREKLLVAGVALGVLATVCGAQGTPADAATSYIAKVATTMRSSVAQAPAFDGVMTIRIRGDRARVDYGVTTPGMPPGTYVLFDASQMLSTLVLPSQKAYIVLDSSMASGTIAQANAMLNPRFSAVTAHRDSLGDGETILGFPSRKFRVGMGMTMDVGAEAFTMAVRTETEVEMDVSEAIAELAPGFAALGRSSGSGGSAGLASGLGGLFRGDTAVKRALAVMTPPRGFVTSQSSTQRMIMRGDTTTTTSSMRLTSLERGGVLAADLLVPEGFTKTDMGAIARQQPQARQPQ